jgi:hypothetical protein
MIERMEEEKKAGLHGQRGQRGPLPRGGDALGPMLSMLAHLPFRPSGGFKSSDQRI